MDKEAALQYSEQTHKISACIWVNALRSNRTSHELCLHREVRAVLNWSQLQQPTQQGQYRWDTAIHCTDIGYRLYQQSVFSCQLANDRIRIKCWSILHLSSMYHACRFTASIISPPPIATEYMQNLQS